MSNKCILPFIRYDFHANKPCCKINGAEYNHEKDYQKLLDDHKNNIQSKFCTHCWKEEKNNIKSKRQRSNEQFKKYLDINESKIISVIIPTGNVCNLYCVTCCPTHSTGWSAKVKPMEKTEFYNRYPIPTPYNKITEAMLKKINWDDVKVVDFLGGETLMSKNLWNYLDFLKEDTSISLLTNGTVVLKDWQIKKCKKFKNLHICFSIDGIEKIFEYVRQPAKWKNVKNNILFYKNSFGKDRLSFHITISNLNIFYIDHIMLELLKILPVKCSFNMVDKPEEFAVNNLTKELGALVEKKNPIFFKNKKIDWNGTEESTSLFFKNIKLQEKFSRIYFKDCMPEYYKLIKEQYPHHLRMM
jgi:hypothetical protein